MRNVYVNRDHEYVSETRICVNTILGDRQPKAVFFFSFRGARILFVVINKTFYLDPVSAMIMRIYSCNNLCCALLNYVYYDRQDRCR